MFFVQTHAVGSEGNPHRLGTARGKEMAQLSASRGHLIEIHTGSTHDHAPHTSRVTEPPYDTTGDGNPDGKNGLESDLLRSKQRITEYIGRTPQFVRAVGLARNPIVNATYACVGLKHIGVNVDSKDNDYPRSSVKQTLTSGLHSVAHVVASGSKPLIVLFHDINGRTADHLGEYIESIASVEYSSSGQEPSFVTSRERAIEILNATHV